jgi:hypothetical protein
MAIKINNDVVIDNSRNFIGSALTVTSIYASGTVGTAGSILSSTGSGLQWISLASDRFTTITANQTTSKTIVNKEFCVVTGAGVTITLPATPSAGFEVAVGIATTSLNTVIARNSTNIMSLAENLTVDTANVVVNLVYTDATRGWRIV